MEPEGYENLATAVEDWLAELRERGELYNRGHEETIFRAAVEMVRGPEIWDTVDALITQSKKRESLPPFPTLSWEEALHEELFKRR